MTTSGSTRSSIAGPGPPPSFLKSTIPMRPVGLQRLRDVAAAARPAAPSRGTRRRSGPRRPVSGSAGSVGRAAAPVMTFLRPISSTRTRDRLDHLPLDVFGEHDAVGPDAIREADGEPAAAGAEVSDDASFPHPQRVHDPFRALPLVAIRRLELPRDPPAGTAVCVARPAAAAARTRRSATAASHRVSDAVHLCSPVPGTPGDVMAPADRIASSCRSGSSFRSRTRSPDRSSCL